MMIKNYRDLHALKVGGWDPYDEELVAPEIPAPPAMLPAAAKKLTKNAANCLVLKALPAKF